MYSAQCEPRAGTTRVLAPPISATLAHAAPASSATTPHSPSSHSALGVFAPAAQTFLAMEGIMSSRFSRTKEKAESSPLFCLTPPPSE